MAVPRDGPRRELVHAHVADEHLVQGVGAGGVPVAQVRAQVLDRLLHLAQHAERLRAEAYEARDVREHEGNRADDRHRVRRHEMHLMEVPPLRHLRAADAERDEQGFLDGGQILRTERPDSRPQAGLVE